MIVPYQESGDEYLMLKNLAKYFRHKFAIGRKWTNDRMLKNVSFKLFKVENVPSFKGSPGKKNELINEAIKTGDLYSGGMYCFAVAAIVLLFFNSLMYQAINPLSPNIHKQILQTDLYTFPYRISWEKLIKDQRFFSLWSFN